MRKILALILTVATIFTLAISFTSCTSPDDGTNIITPANPDAVKTLSNLGTNIKIGIILLHNDQIGYDAAHIEGIKTAVAELGIPDSNVIWKYDIPEDEKCYDAARELATAGCNLIFADSFGHESYIIQAAKEFPEILFCHATGQTANDQQNAGVKNVFNYFTDVFESRYVSGVVAGMKIKELVEANALTAQNKTADGKVKLGYVGAFPYAEVVSGYTAFFLGVQSVYADVAMEVTYTSSWADPTAEGAAAQKFINDGCVIISQHADTTGAPAKVEAARTAGNQNVFCVGYNVSMLEVAPTGALTSAQNVWSVCYKKLIETAMTGGKLPINSAYGYEADGVKISALGPSCAAGTAEKVAEVEAALKADTLKVFDTNKFTVGGAKLTSYKNSFGFVGTELIWDGYFHESELISAPLFDIRIDGITEATTN